MDKDNQKVCKPKKILTDEEKENRRNYNREYARRRKLVDPEFVQRQRDASRKSAQRDEAKEQLKIKNSSRAEYYKLRYMQQKERHAALLNEIEEMENKINK